ncbi:MAG: glutamate racemase, partial [Gemmatimonadales bacterium]|nr:glutamate racemase [Gemmatimonadales bacterium]
HAIFEHFPNDSTVYVGDTARVPYGPKSADTVRRYSLEILAWLLRQRVKAVVVACNTSTAHALEALEAASPVPVLGVIEPGARAAVAAASGKPIGVIGTVGTIASGAYERAIRRLDPDVQVVTRACPLFVPLVEEGYFDHPATRIIAEEYLAPLQQQGIGSLVLGCTHYPLLKPLLGRVMGPQVKLIDSGEETARALAGVLAARGLEAPSGAGRPVHRFAVTDDPARFLSVGARFLGERLSDAEVVTLGTA